MTDDMVWVTGATYHDPNVAILRGAILDKVVTLSGSMDVFCKQKVHDVLTVEAEVAAMYFGARVMMTQINDAVSAAPKNARRPNRNLIKMARQLEGRLIALESHLEDLSEPAMINIIVAIQKYIRESYAEVSHAYDAIQAAATNPQA